MAQHRNRPESLMMTHGYRPEWSEGALKCPIFQTSTFVFRSAKEGKAFFELAYGLRKKGPTEQLGLIYSRLNNPDLEILEDRIALWEEAPSCAVFASGMAAITTVLLEFVRPGDIVLHSEPIYGGTDYFLKHMLPRMGARAVGFPADGGPEAMERALKSSGTPERVSVILVETPANPTNALVDIKAAADLARRRSTRGRKVICAVDNTFLGPLWQRPLDCGADLVLYSATKFLGGHSDVVAGAVLGDAECMQRVRTLRTFLGTALGPWSGWLLLRSLETLKLRMTCQMKNARRVADYLAEHPRVERVYYLGRLEPKSPQGRLYSRQCSAPGSVISFDVKGGEREAFRFLDSLRLVKLAVSLGGTESLAEHPASMTHSDVEPSERLRLGVTDKMIRLSIGVENPDDIIADLARALR